MGSGINESINIQFVKPSFKGARISDGTDFKQAEFLFPRNAEYRIIEPPKLVKDEYNPTSKHYEMVIEYVLPNVKKK